MHKTRDFKKTIYTKTIGIDPLDLRYVDRVRGKKSKAGKLKEIITTYKQYELSKMSSSTKD